MDGTKGVVMDLDTLYACAAAGDPGAIASLEKKADRLNKDGRTILHIESLYGNTERVQFILTKFAHKNLLVKLDGFNQTALHLAANSGHTEVVEVLIDAARRLPSPVNDDLHNPVGNCFEAFVRQADEKMNTALHLAVSNCHMDITKLLVEADPSDRHLQNHHDETPLYLAAKLGYIDIVELICKACTAPSLDGPDGTTAFHPFIMKWSCNVDEEKFDFAAEDLIDAAKRSDCYEDAPYNSFEALFTDKDANGCDVLQLAVQENNPYAVGLILDKDPAYQHGRSSKKKYHKSLIYMAAEKRYNATVNVLCDTYEDGNTVDYEQQTRLQAAIIGHDRASVVRVLEYHTPDYRGWTPLHYAAYYEFDSILDLLVITKESVKCDSVCRANVPTPLHIAAKEGHASIVVKLIRILPQSSCDVNDMGENVLHILALQRNKKLIQSVLKYFPVEALNQKDQNGDTPLHIFVRKDCYVPELIKHRKVEKMALNNREMTPFDMLYGSEEITGDQVQYKMALDNARGNKLRKIWRRIIKDGWSDDLKLKASNNTECRMESTFLKAKKLLIQDMIKREKDNLKLVKDDLERYRQRTNIQIIVTALIATVTFTVGFTMPGGYTQSGEPDQGLAVLSKKNVFNAFMVSDALALVLSISSLFFYFIASMYDDPRRVSKLIAASTVLNIVSVIAMMLTFVAGTYVVFSDSPALVITVCLICCFFFILVIVQLIKMIFNRKPNRIHEV